MESQFRLQLCNTKARGQEKFEEAPPARAFKGTNPSHPIPSTLTGSGILDLFRHFHQAQRAAMTTPSLQMRTGGSKRLADSSRFAQQESARAGRDTACVCHLTADLGDTCKREASPHRCPWLLLTEAPLNQSQSVVTSGLSLGHFPHNNCSPLQRCFRTLTELQTFQAKYGFSGCTLCPPVTEVSCSLLCFTTCGFRCLRLQVSTKHQHYLHTSEAHRARGDPPLGWERPSRRPSLQHHLSLRDRLTARTVSNGTENHGAVRLLSDAMSNVLSEGGSQTLATASRGAKIRPGAIAEALSLTNNRCLFNSNPPRASL